MDYPYTETVIGYDCREMWLPNVESWTDEAKAGLLRPDVERLFTIGRFGWNSIFAHNTTHVDDKAVGTVPGYTLSIPYESRTADSFWDDDEAMMDFVQQHLDAYQQPFWAMAFSVVQMPKYEQYLNEWLETRKSYFVSLPLDINPRQQPDWTFLGYDVQDTGPSFWEGLGRVDYLPDDIQSLLREKWGRFLNKYHLFEDQTAATEYSDWQEKAEHHPYFAYGLYLMRSYP